MAGGNAIGTGAVILTANADQMLGVFDKTHAATNQWAQKTTKAAEKAGGGKGLFGAILGGAAGGAAAGLVGAAVSAIVSGAHKAIDVVGLGCLVVALAVVDEDCNPLMQPAAVPWLPADTGTALVNEIIRRNKMR